MPRPPSTSTTPLISRPYVDITTGPDAPLRRQRSIARRLGVPRTAPARAIASPARSAVEGRASGASLLSSLPARSAAGPVRVTGVGRDSIQGDVAFADVLAAAGAPTSRFGDDWIEARAARTSRRQRRSICIDDSRRRDDARDRRRCSRRAADDASSASARWRVKGADPHRGDGDRARAKLGATVEAGATGCASHPLATLRPRRSTPTTTTGWRCASRSRRWAMPAARSTIPSCVRKTFPGYFDAFPRSRHALSASLRAGS